ncbi:LysR family transcriptional regulator (plasmid) [Bradyrhizobium sp. 62B]|uniref:LysR family transcriptional regulator n=1 Tax=Bradyrhizobium sp. 62B TaxID=2898442 RepID=UPI00255811B5|nr:LysR family transcriptional regulator [Bradyrhizobium sp. 62B]
MDFKFLSNFLKVADLQNVTAAGAVLNVAPTALSRQIKLLEHEFGAVLFERSARGMRLTTEGEALVAGAGRLLTGYRHLRTEVALASGQMGGTLDLGVLPSLEASVLPPIIAAFRSRYPEVYIRVTVGLGKELEALLRREKLDLALLYDVDGTLGGRTMRVSTEALMLVGCVSRAFDYRRAVPLEALRTYKMILTSEEGGLRNKIEKAYAHRFSTPLQERIVMEANSILTLKNVLPGSDLVTILPQNAIEQELVNRILSATYFADAPSLSRTLCVCYPPCQVESRLAQLFETIVSEEVRRRASRYPAIQSDEASYPSTV